MHQKSRITRVSQSASFFNIEKGLDGQQKINSNLLTVAFFLAKGVKNKLSAFGIIDFWGITMVLGSFRTVDDFFCFSAWV